MPLLDTQTGLRGYLSELLGWLQQVGGERFEYELNLLLQARAAGVEFVQVPIQTIYLAGNESSHFRPVADSWRVYRPLLAHGLRRATRGLRFTASSLLGFGIDTVALLVLQPLLGSLLAAIVLARLLSAAVNFGVNRGWVFAARGPDDADAVASREPLWPSLRRYGLLAAGLLAAN